MGLLEHLSNTSPGQLVIVDEASLAATAVLDELVTAATDAGAKVLLIGGDAQLSAVEAGGMFAALIHGRDGLAPALSDVRRFHHDWEKAASVELRAGDEDAIDAYEAHDRITADEREQLLDALYRSWQADIEVGRSSLMIAGDLGTVSELNARARADRVAAGEVAEHGVDVAGGGTAGVGDRVVTRQNNRLIATGSRWVRNGDRWMVTATHDDGAMTVRRLHGGGTVTLPAEYVAEQVELAYASTAHRSQGRTVDTAHALVAPTTTREVLYVSATRGRDINRLYVDTHYDPDPATGHDRAIEAATAREVLAGVLRNEGAERAAHEMLRRAHDEAEGMERLAAEYTTLATAAQAQRWDALLTRSGLSATELEAVRASPAHGPLLAAFRDAESRGLDVASAFPRLATRRPLAGAEDVASVLHARVDHWVEAAGRRRRGPEHLVAGLIPRTQRITDPEMARTLAERHLAMEDRVRTLAEQAVLTGQAWVRPLGHPPAPPAQRDQWLRQIATVAAYRDLWHITSSQTLGHATDVGSTEQLAQLRRAQLAARRAVTLSQPKIAQPAPPAPELTTEPYRGIER